MTDSAQNDQAIHIPRILELSKAEDRDALLEAVGDRPDWSDLIAQHLDDYLQLFKHPDWRRVYSGGIVTRSGKAGGTGRDLTFMLELTRDLKTLQHLPGFDLFVAHFDNPTQFGATVFETQVALWRVSRRVTVGFEFSPEVYVKGRPKYPDFLWETELGKLYCECKRAEVSRSEMSRKLDRLERLVEGALKQFGPLADTFRLDVLITGPLPSNFNRVLPQLVASVVSEARVTGSEASASIDEAIAATVRSRATLPPVMPRSLRKSQVIVGTTPTRRDASNATYTVTLSIGGYQAGAAVKALAAARTQIPDDAVGAVFLECGSAESIKERVGQVLSDPVSHKTPWVALCSPGKTDAVYLNNQPFDERLLEDKEQS